MSEGKDLIFKKTLKFSQWLNWNLDIVIWNLFPFKI